MRGGVRGDDDDARGRTRRDGGRGVEMSGVGVCVGDGDVKFVVECGIEGVFFC